MIRLNLKNELICECCDIFRTLNMYGESVPKSFYRRAVNTIRRDFNKGIREINKKAKVYVELPKIKPEGNGMYSQEVKGSNKDKEIIVTPQDTLLP